jgi:hypothetical protein
MNFQEKEGVKLEVTVNVFADVWKVPTAFSVVKGLITV